MGIHNSAFQILRMIQDGKLEDDRLLRYIKTTLEYDLENAARPQGKDLMLRWATESGRSEFKLIGKVNDGGLSLMEWCDDAQNFDGMCSSIESLTSHKDGEYLRRTYSLEELPEVIDNALSWFNSVKSRSPFRDDQLHILAVK